MLQGRLAEILFFKNSTSALHVHDLSFAEM